MQFPLDAKLKDGSGIQLVLANDHDIEPLRRLYRVIVDEGSSYPHDQFPGDEEFLDYWIRGKSTVVVHLADRVHDEKMLGAFYLKQNCPAAPGTLRMPALSSPLNGVVKGWAGY